MKYYQENFNNDLEGNNNDNNNDCNICFMIIQMIICNGCYNKYNSNYCAMCRQ